MHGLMLCEDNVAAKVKKVKDTVDQSDMLQNWATQKGKLKVFKDLVKESDNNLQKFEFDGIVTEVKQIQRDCSTRPWPRKKYLLWFEP